MKTLCFTLGLLLLTACCCNAMPEALQISTAPGNCCFKFYSHRIPAKVISNITKTHISCVEQAFIVQTSKAKMICIRQTSQWALKVFNQFHNTEGSSQQN